MEEEASKVYTGKMFRIFQDELVGSQIFVAEEVKGSSEVSEYKVHEFYKEKPSYYVIFHVTSNEATCNCHKFDFLGILCRHVLSVFLKKNVYSLPSQYVLQRWTLNAKKEKVKGLIIEELQEGGNKASSTSLFNSIMAHSLELSERGSRSEKHHDIAIQCLNSAVAKLDLLDLKESNEDFVNSTSEVLPKASDIGITLHDPPVAATKGHPRTLQMKSSLELRKKGSSTCSSCKNKGHTKRKCPNLNQTR